MIEDKKKLTSITEVLNTHGVVVYLQSKFIVLQGRWQWDMASPAVYCSDVMLQMPGDFIGTKGIIHPDDLEMVQEKLLLLQPNEPIDIEFRIINTYGKVKTISGENILPAEADEEVLQRWENSLAEKGYKDVVKSKEATDFFIKKKLADNAEKVLQTGTWYINTNTYFTYYSDNVYRIYGMAPQSLNAHPNTFISYIHPDDSESVKHAFDKAYNKNLPLHIEFRIIGEDDKLKYVRQIIYWDYNDKGELNFCGILQDISEQKRIEEELEEEQNKNVYQSQISYFQDQASQTGKWEVNLLTRKIEYSDNCYRMFGLNQKIGLTSNGFINFVHSDDREEVALVQKKILTEHIAPDIDFRIIRKDGTTKYLRQRGKLINYGESEIVMVGTLQDVSAIKIQEKKIHELKNILELGEVELKRIEDSLKVGSWMLELDTGVETWSKGFYEILGYKKSTVEINHKIFNNFIHPDDKKIFTAHVKSAENDEETGDLIFRIITKGEIKYLKASFNVLHLEDKNIFSCIMHDVTSEQLHKQQLLNKVNYAEIINETVNDRIIVTDLHHNILDWNNSSRLTYNLKKEEVLGKNIFDVFPKLKTQKILSYYHAALSGEVVFEKGLKAVHSKGYYDIHLVPLKDEKGEVSGIVHFLHDVTKEVELQQDLTMRLGFIENILEASVDRIIVVDKNMNYLLWNKKCEEYYGIRREEVIGKNILEIFPGSQNELTHIEFKKALLGETVHISAKKGLGGNYEEVYLIPVKDDKQHVTAVLWLLHDLTKEYALAQQQKKTNQVLDALNECYVELDNNFGFSYVNTMAEGFFQKRREDLLGKPVIEVFPEVEGSAIYMAMVQAFEEGIRTVDEFKSSINNHWLYLSCAPTLDGIVMMFYDIQDIKENKLLTRQIMEATPDFVMVFNFIQNKIEFVNRNAYRDNEDRYIDTISLDYDGILNRAHPDDRQGLHQFIQSFKNAGDNEIRAFEYRVVNNEQVTWYRTRGKIFKRDEAGNVTHYISVIQDFTDEVNLRSQLMERTRYAENIFDASINRMFVFDKNFIIHAWNKKCEEYHNKTKEETLGKSLLHLFPKIKKNKAVMNAIDKAFEGAHSYVAPEKEMYSDKITERFYVPLVQDDGAVQSVLCVLHDVTKTTLANKSLEQKNAELLEKNEEITNFAFVASHDLKEPIRKIHYFTHYLLDHEAEKISNRGKNYLNKLNNSIERLNFLMEDILALTKIHSEKIQKPEDVDLNKVLTNLLDEMKEEIEAGEVVLEVSTLPIVKGSENQVSYLIKNLLNNALKFHKDFEHPQIKIWTEDVTINSSLEDEAPKNYTRISFSDKGIGFNQKFVHKIFQIFQKLQNDFEGTGIGLAICKKVMENHNGFITAESNVGEGSAFHCFFPKK